MQENSKYWIETLSSEVNPDFISNPFPAEGEKITISLRVVKAAPIFHIWITGLMEGENFKAELLKGETCQRFSYYQIELLMKGDALNYHFMIESSEGFFYLNSRGVQTIPSVKHDDYTILMDLKYPSWVAGAVFYQIFPDRFRSSDDDLGVRAGEYEFDGVATSEIPWSEEPPEFEMGRCVDFYNGDLGGIADSIDHFQRLSVDALYLNPIFSAKTNHRYDCTDYFTVDEHLGGNEALIDLTERLHKAGMSIIVDVSINHTGTEHEWFKRAQADPDSLEASYYYRNEDDTFAYWYDVPTLPQLNYGSEELRRKIWKDPDALVRSFIAEPFNLDGWRFDVANEVGRRGKDQFCHEIWQEVRRVVKDQNPESYIIGEHWEDASAYLQGDQWDGSMNYFGAGRPIRSWLGELDRFLMANWGHDPKMGRHFTGVELKQAIEQSLEQIPDQLHYVQYNLVNSHDTPRLQHHKAIWDFDLYSGALYLLFSLPGAVSYFYGDEIGISGHPKSVEGARFPMVWDNSSWDMSIYELYRDLGAMRRTYRRIFSFGGFKSLYADQKVYGCARYTLEEALITVINRSDSASSVVLPTSAFGINSCRTLLGDADLRLGTEYIELSLAPRKSVILICECVR